MRLKRLEIAGFKSFAKRTTLEFDVPITAIVGPNGSGKSNVAEALRWVLGEQSMKSLRGKRGEDLIFNGAGAGSRLNQARVSLYFDNGDNAFNIEFPEIAVSREVYRDGTNSYSLNGSQVRLRDIVEMLSAVSLGASGHHIISQGEADRVLSANLRERREMLEDALGLKIYQFKLTESAKRLEKTEENMRQVESLRREIAPHLKFLRKQVEEAEKAAATRGELAVLAVQYFSNEARRLDGVGKEVAEEIERAKNELEKVEGELSRDNRTPRMQEVSAELGRLRMEKDEITRDIGRLEGKIEAGKREELTRVDERGEERCRYCGQIIVKKEMEKRETPDFSKMLVEKASLEEKLRVIASSESERYAELEKLREGERVSYELRARESALRGDLNRARLRESQLCGEREVFAREAHEVSILTGVNVLAGESQSLGKEEFQELRRRVERLKIKVEDAGGVSSDVFKEHEDTKDRDAHLAKELEDMEQSAASLRALIRELTATLEGKFKEGLSLVNGEFGKFFELLFGGGKAEVFVAHYGGGTDEAGDEIEKEWGIDINVSLPRKKIKGLEMLSGGERALTSIALLFAMSRVNPPPFLVLDETDAALDEANSRKYGEMLENLSKKSQLIVVTHNRETMSHASVLYGVAMGADGISKLLSIRFDDATAFAK